uniref:ZAD domain-containing protein n=1 Tax=Anopheles atroparvus TaxID=41427 RepID=A0AAG5DJ65_ANOAO
MATRIGEIEKICRFCLSHQGLMALSKATSSTFALEDVIRCSGIQISKEEKLPYAICNDCYKAINNSVCFRRTCLRNDSVFKTLVSVLNVSVKESGEASETQTNDPAGSTMFSEFDETASGNAIITLHDSDSNDSISSLNGEFMQRAFTTDAGKSLSPVAIGDDADIDAASNSVEIDLVSMDSSDSDYSMPSLYGEAVADNPTNIPSSSTQQSAKEKSTEKELCQICGVLVNYVYHHLKRTHDKEVKFTCPFCPKKVREKFQLKEHINTWHLKRITYTCQYCGRGFTNHGSYFYHMSNSHGKSDVYECKICHRKLKSWDGYKKHMKEHSVTAIKCKDCGKLYKNNATLEFHRLHYHASTP